MMTKCKVYIVLYGEGDIVEVFESKKLASEYIWDWDNRSKWIDAGYDLDSFYWIEKELVTE